MDDSNRIEEPIDAAGVDSYAGDHEGDEADARAYDGDAIEVPTGPDGEPDWDAYYSDPRFGHFIGPQHERAAMPLMRRYRANGSVMAAVALGFREVFDPHHAKVEIVQERDDSGDPDRPNKPFHLDFDPDDPTATRAIVRPHLRD